MKKMLLVLAVIAMAVPAMAGVVISGADQGDLSAVISYDASSMSELVRAFALNISVDGGAKITGVDVLNADYNIYPGSIDINSVTGVVDSNGSAIADANAYPNTDTLGGIGTAGVTIEMGSLEFVPAAADVLVKITVDKACTVTVEENAPRAGIVMEDPTLDADPTLPVFQIAAVSTVCTGDIDGNGYTNKNDLLNLVNYLTTNGAPPFYSIPSSSGAYLPEADIDGNGYANKNDLLNLVTYLTTNGTPPFYSIACPQ